MDHFSIIIPAALFHCLSDSSYCYTYKVWAAQSPAFWLVQSTGFSDEVLRSVGTDIFVSMSSVRITHIGTNVRWHLRCSAGLGAIIQLSDDCMPSNGMRICRK